jgi:pyrroline-5-carboxylate reductase
MIILVGCGKMGGAMLSGWIARGVAPETILVVEPHPPTLPAGARVFASAADLPANIDPKIIILAVKPQVMAEIAPPYARFAGKAAYLSIAAGKTIGFFEKTFGGEAAIVRAMPNTPAMLGRGVTGAFANLAAAPFKAECEELLAAVGEVVWVDKEADIDAVTALSGSGPAYVFLLAEAMAEAGVAAGLPADLAGKLARATVAGAGEMLHRLPESATQLRQNVTSPGGTTAAALSVLMADNGLTPLLTKAIAAAAQRSRELASS